MDLLCILVCCGLVLICIELTIFACAILYVFLVAAYDVVSGWVQNLKWKWRCARRRRK